MSDDVDGDKFDPDFDEQYFDDEPFADPAIRAGYQDALGRFIMAHNEVDFWMTGILTKAVAMIPPDGSLNNMAMGDFNTRAGNLVLLSKVAPHLGFGGTANRRLAELNGTRNVLAHGHFDQDRYEGTFEIVSRRHNSLKARRLNNLNAEVINAQAGELERIARTMSAVWDFIDYPVPVEYIEDEVSKLSAALWEAQAVKRASEAATVDASVSVAGSGPA